MSKSAERSIAYYLKDTGWHCTCISIVIHWKHTGLHLNNKTTRLDIVHAVVIDRINKTGINVISTTRSLSFSCTTIFTSIRETSYLEEEVLLTKALWQHEEGGHHSTFQVGHQGSSQLAILTLHQHFHLHGNSTYMVLDGKICVHTFLGKKKQKKTVCQISKRVWSLYWLVCEGVQQHTWSSSASGHLSETLY